MMRYELAISCSHPGCKQKESISGDVHLHGKIPNLSVPCCWTRIELDGHEMFLCLKHSRELSQYHLHVCDGDLGWKLECVRVGKGG